MSTSEMPLTDAVLTTWVTESRLSTRPAAMQAARAAMHAARAAAPAAPQRDPRLRLRVALPLAPRRHPVWLTSSCLTAAAALVIAVGWNAGPGSPLHPIQQAKEDASLVMASGSQAAGLRLGYAEARLRSAAAGSDQQGNVAEATSLLNAARQDLPADHADPLWTRWQHDEGVLNTLSGTGASSAPPVTATGESDGSGTPEGSGSSHNAGNGGGDDGAGGSGGDGHAGSGSDGGSGTGSGAGGATTPSGGSPSPSVGGDGGHDGGGSSSPTPSASGGGSGSSGGGSSGGPRPSSPSPSLSGGDDGGGVSGDGGH